MLMNVSKSYKTLCDFELGKPDIKAQVHVPFYRIGYFLHLQSAAFGNQWIYTEFDTWTQDTRLVGVPVANGSFIKRSVNNLEIRDSNGRNETGLADGHIEFSAYNYAPGANNYDTSDDLAVWVNQGNYGCMQVHSGTNVLWAFNHHNASGLHDIGIGNNTTSVHKDWTFTNNSNIYTVKNMRIVLVSLDVSFSNNNMYNIDMRGVIHGDSLIWNKHSESWGQTQIPYKTHGNINEPNFIIALTGQSNSQGVNSFYDSNVSEDQPHERILGFNPTNQAWEVADLNTESLGAYWHKPQGSQSLAFHAAKCLVEAYPDICVGIINLGVGGQPICRWAKFAENEHWYSLNTSRANNIGVLQGDIYDLHVSQINAGLSNLSTHKTIDAIFWHQGESDGWDTDPNYYADSIRRVIDQYRSLVWCNKQTPFVVGETTGADYSTDIGWEARNVQLRNLNDDADPFTLCLNSADLTTSNDQYNNGDTIHFSAHAQRIMGTRYFKALRSMYQEKN